MNNTLIDLSEDRLLSVASDLIDNHNLTGALKILNKSGGLHGDSDESLMMYAEIYDDMGLYEKSINAWFGCLDCLQNEDIAEVYEGLAMCYMNIGNDHFAAYYYNKLLLCDNLSKENREEILKSFMKKEEPPLRFVYPPSLADYSDDIKNGVEYMRLNDYENAVKSFEEVEEGNEKHASARNYIAMCKIICDKYEEAEQECLRILEKNPQNVQALTTLAAVKTEQKKGDESRALAERLLRIGATSSDDIYKIATVCCENKMHKEAYDMFLKLEDELGYDSSVLFFKAVSAYNCGKTQESLAAFDKLVTIYPDAVTAAFYYDKVRDNIEEGKTEEIGYFYRLPQEERESTLKFLAAFRSLSKKNAAELCKSVDISFCVKWCFDEGNFRDNSELQALAASCAVYAGLDDFVRKLLLNAFLPDALKIQILNDVAERNEGGNYGLVICNMYSTVELMPLQVGRTKRKQFVAAYSHLVSRFCILDDGYCAKFNSAAVRLYGALSDASAFGDVRDVETLTAVIYGLSGVKESGVNKDICDFFDADRERYRQIISYALR